MIYRISCTTSLFIKRFFKLVRILLEQPLMGPLKGWQKHHYEQILDLFIGQNQQSR